MYRACDFLYLISGVYGRTRSSDAHSPLATGTEPGASVWGPGGSNLNLKAQRPGPVARVTKSRGSSVLDLVRGKTLEIGVGSYEADTRCPVLTWATRLPGARAHVIVRGHCCTGAGIDLGPPYAMAGTYHVLHSTILTY
eukprot:3034634-Rhodomonas_salina.1